MNNTSQRFQVNLSGVIDILSQHLYSGPQVFIRELLQNATDAIQARLNLESTLTTKGNITLTLDQQNPDKKPMLHIMDNGIGLTESEIHQFLAVIGQSSKSQLLEPVEHGFIGQFGIGLLACFMVSEEIVLHTRSAKAPDQVHRWIGKPDGTYQVDTVNMDLPIGTQVSLRSKNHCTEYFTEQSLSQWLKYYGAYLPHAIDFIASPNTPASRINPLSPPWQWQDVNSSQFIDKALAVGEQHFQAPFFDIIPLSSETSQVKGIAYVSSSPSMPNGQQKHMVYLKGMRIADTSCKLLPEWAFFVRTVINSNSLRPTASRESLYEDAMLENTRKHLGEQLINYLIELSEKDPQKFQHFVHIHQASLKSLSIENTYFCQKIVPHLRFETNFGHMSLQDYLSKNSTISYINSVDAFRQIAQVATAEQHCIINAGYAWDSQLLQQYSSITEYPLNPVDPESIVKQLQDIDEGNPVLTRFLKRAQQQLKDICPHVSLKQFQPQALPTLYITCEKFFFIRSAKKNKKESNSLWSGIIENIVEPMESYAHNQLCLNANNPLIQGVMQIEDNDKLQQYLKILYVQSLLMGHFPLDSEELNILNGGLLALMESEIFGNIWNLNTPGNTH